MVSKGRKQYTQWTSQSGKFTSEFDQVDQLLDRDGKSRNALTRIVGGGYDASGTHTVTLHTWMDIKDVSKHFFFEVMKGIKCYAMDSKHK